MKFMSKTVIAQTRINLMVSSAIFVAGMSYSWPLSMVPKLTDPDLPGHLSIDEMGWVVSMAYLASILSPIICNFFIDRAGRKSMFLLSVVPCIASNIIGALKPTSFPWLCIARFNAGFFSIITFIIHPMYVGEIVENEIRGVSNAITLLFLQLSSLFSAVIGIYFDTSTFALVSCLIVVVACILILFIPESPHYLLLCGDMKGAYKSLQVLRAKNDVTGELMKITSYIDKRRNLSTGLVEFVTHYRKLMGICLLICTVIVMCGNTFIQNYGAMIFDEAGYKLSGTDCLIILEAILTIALAITSFFIHNFGRRQLLAVGVGTISLFLFIAGLYYNLKGNGYNVSCVNWIPLITLIGSTCIYYIFIGSVCSTIITEIFPINVKSAANTFFALTSSVFITVSMKVFQVIDTTYGTYLVMYIFSISTLVFGVTLILFLPETKDKSFEEIEDDMRNHSISKVFRLTRTDTPYTTS